MMWILGCLGIDWLLVDWIGDWFRLVAWLGEDNSGRLLLFLFRFV